jgi:hypothetical protein
LGLRYSERSPDGRNADVRRVNTARKTLGRL